MEINNDKNSRGASEISKKGLYLYPVSAQASGKGLPYAPVDWPEPGDIWRWKVGNRVAASGHFMDRYLYLPKRLQSVPKERSFASKLSVEQYVQKIGADVKAFFASFSWKIPSSDRPELKAEYLVSELQPGIRLCKAGNKSCGSLVELQEALPGHMVCDICCSEPGFCRDCCCILCSMNLDLAYGGYSFIRCEAAMEDGVICGHLAHIGCALRSYMAGTVGGSIGLDAEYYCRRCDTRTDLLSHVTKLLQICETIEARDDIAKILNLGASVLRGSQRLAAMKLLDRIELVMGKLGSGTCLEDVWKMEDTSAANSGSLIHDANDALESSMNEKPAHDRVAVPQKVSESFDPLIESLKLEIKVDEMLGALKKSQELEYTMVRDKLYEQKNYLQNLYQQLKEEKAELAQHGAHNADRDALFRLVVNRLDQINRGVIKLKEMEEVARGCGRTSKRILKEHFDLQC
ncbi:CDPK adapter protein 1 [Heracleum sosnowskyi]|uniref:CDPK adapter protein 1 n=1 Tax=Heracleum sosnowskyi TaxID=360622 RepID=A0AAD8MY16_9APIA|nr:CDPK adapter protein 1 [Heracleum sosnowskyi]